MPLLLCEFARLYPAVEVALAISDTQRVITEVAERELELGIVGAARRARGLVFETLVRDEIVLALPAGHRFAGTRIDPSELAGETLIEMQAGAGVRQVVEEELRRARARLQPRARLELGLQESVKSAVLAGHGVGFISRTAIEDELEAGTLGAASLTGLTPAREIYLVSAPGRSRSRAARAFIQFAKERAA